MKHGRWLPLGAALLMAACNGSAPLSGPSTASSSGSASVETTTASLSSVRAAKDGLTVTIAAASPTFGVAPVAVQFTSTVSGGNGEYIYSWSFGNGSGSSEANPVVTYIEGGDYRVSLLVVSGDERATSNTLAFRIDSPVRLACFTDPTVGFAPLKTAFRAEPQGGMGEYGYNWNFGDGGTSREKEPVHTYNQGGTFVARGVVDSGTFAITCLETITVYDPFDVSCTATPSSGPAALAVKFKAHPNACLGDGCTFNWDFGDGQGSDEWKPSHTFGNPGTYHVHVTARTKKEKATCGLTITVQ